MSAKSIHRTAVFKIHNPPLYARRAIDVAMRTYTHAAREILKKCSVWDVDEIERRATFAISDKGKPLTSDKQLVKSVFPLTQPFALESGLREALAKDICGTLLSYLELARGDKQQPSFPSRQMPNAALQRYQQALRDITVSANNRAYENALFAILQESREEKLLPLAFSRIEAERGCGLFYHQESNRFFTRIFLQARNSTRVKAIQYKGIFIDIRTGKKYVAGAGSADGELNGFGRGTRSILVPLECGNWHEQPQRFTRQTYLATRTVGYDDVIAASPMAAKLMKTDEGEYELHVSFAFTLPERVTTQTILGIDRGIHALAAGAVVSEDGTEILHDFYADGTALRSILREIERTMQIRQQKGKLTTKDRRRSAIGDIQVHAIANAIVEEAIQYRAQVVMENLSSFSLTTRTKGTRRSNFRAMLPRRQYQKLLELVNQKLQFTGLPAVFLVRAAYTSQTCSQCGHISKNNRDQHDRTRFLCEQCGYRAHADIQAGVNIARKLLWVRHLRETEKVKREQMPWEEFNRSILDKAHQQMVTFV